MQARPPLLKKKSRELSRSAFKSRNNSFLLKNPNIFEEIGADILKLSDKKRGGSLLHYLVRRADCEKTVVAFIENFHEVEINKALTVQNQYGNTVFHSAFKCNPRNAPLLIDAANPKTLQETALVLNRQGYSFLHYAALNFKENVFSSLLDKLGDDALNKAVFRDPSILVCALVNIHTRENASLLLSRLNSETIDKTLSHTEKKDYVFAYRMENRVLELFLNKASQVWLPTALLSANKNGKTGIETLTFGHVGLLSDQEMLERITLLSSSFTYLDITYPTLCKLINTHYADKNAFLVKLMRLQMSKGDIFEAKKTFYRLSNLDDLTGEDERWLCQYLKLDANDAKLALVQQKVDYQLESLATYLRKRKKENNSYKGLFGLFGYSTKDYLLRKNIYDKLMAAHKRKDSLGMLTIINAELPKVKKGRRKHCAAILEQLRHDVSGVMDFRMLAETSRDPSLRSG